MGEIRRLGHSESQPRTREEFGLKGESGDISSLEGEVPGDLWPVEYQEKRCGKRRHRCSEECMGFIGGS